MPHVTVVQTTAEFDEMSAHWDGLVAQSDHDNPFRRWAWMRSWWKHYGDNKKLLVIAVHDGGDLVGIAPLFVNQKTAHIGTRSLQFFGTGQTCAEYLGFIVRSGCEAQVVPAILDALATEYMHLWDVMRLTDIPLGSQQLKEFERFVSVRSLYWSRRDGTSNLLVDFPGDWDEFLKSLSSKRRTKIRRVLKTFDHEFQGEYALVKTPEQYERIWPELERLHNLHWADAGLQGCFETPAFLELHREVSRHYLDHGQLVLAALCIDGQAIAVCYGIRQGETVYEYQRGHDPAWLTHRPGHALQYYMFKEQMNAGVRCWDYLRGDYQHKRDWSTSRQPTVDLFAAAPRHLATPRYLAEHCYRTIRGRLKLWRNRAKAHR